MKALGPKKALQRRRKMRHFIDAADRILSEKGLEALTIRGVSEIAGYNSATLYGYFSSLDHLIYNTYMKEVPALHAILTQTEVSDQSPEKALESVWRAFCTFAYEHPNAVYTLMFSKYAADFQEILEDYRHIYTDVLPENDDAWPFRDALFDPVLTQLVAFERYLNLNASDVEALNGFIQTYFQGQLVRLMTVESTLNLATYLSRMTLFMDQLIWSYTVKRK